MVCSGKRWSLFVALVSLGLSLFAISTHAVALEMDGYEPDFPDNISTLMVDQQSAQSRTLTMGDMDYARIPVVAGRSYVFSALAKPSYRGNDLQMVLWPGTYGLPDVSVSSLQRSTTFPGSGLTQIRYTATETGSVVLSIETDPAFSGECAYWLAAYTDGQPWWEDPYELNEVTPGSPGTFASVDAPPVTRCLDGFGDVDTFDVFIPNPGHYVISTGFSSLDLPPDTSIEVWDFGGTTRVANDDGPDGGPLSEVRITATQPDIWRIQVSSPSGTQAGAYTLSVSTAPMSSGRVMGSVVGPSGEPVAFTPVLLISPESFNPMAPPPYEQLESFAQTTTDGSGSFNFDAVPFGVPFLAVAYQEGSGLVPAVWPEVRDWQVSNGEHAELSAENPVVDRQLRIKLPWVEGTVKDTSLSQLSGLLDVYVHDLSGNVIGTTRTWGDGGFRVSLPAGTEQCKLEVRDPAGVYRTTWYDGKSTEASAATIDLPTFHPLSMTVREVADPDFLDNYRISLAGVTMVFDRAANPPGMVIGNQASQNPVPQGFRLIAGRTYQIHPQMQFWGQATVTMSIPANEAANAANIRMFHWVNGAWQDVTSNVDISGMKVTGTTDSFSEFALMEAPAKQAEVSTPAASWWSTSLFAVLLSLGFAFVPRLQKGSSVGK